MVYEPKFSIPLTRSEVRKRFPHLVLVVLVPILLRLPLLFSSIVPGISGSGCATSCPSLGQAQQHGHGRLLLPLYAQNADKSHYADSTSTLYWDSIQWPGCNQREHRRDVAAAGMYRHG